MGINGFDCYTRLIKNPVNLDAYTGSGNTNYMAANRISYFFNFIDPILSWMTLSFTKTGFMAADGRCKTFESSADHYVRSEGAGVVVLKPLSQALTDKDKDPVYAISFGDTNAHVVLEEAPEQASQTVKDINRSRRGVPHQPSLWWRSERRFGTRYWVLGTEKLFQNLAEVKAPSIIFRLITQFPVLFTQKQQTIEPAQHLLTKRAKSEQAVSEQNNYIEGEL